jgi:hypothetical protein
VRSLARAQGDATQMTSDDWNLLLAGAKCLTFAKNATIIAEGVEATRIYQVCMRRVCCVIGDIVCAAQIGRGVCRAEKGGQRLGAMQSGEVRVRACMRLCVPCVRACVCVRCVSSLVDDYCVNVSTTQTFTVLMTVHNDDLCAVWCVCVCVLLLCAIAVEVTSKSQIFGEISFLEGGKTTAAVVAEQGDVNVVCA